MAEEKNFENKKIIFIAGWFLAVTVVFLWVGMNINVPQGESVAFRVPDGDILKYLTQMCFLDIFSFVLVSVVNNRVRIGLATVLIAYRGAALGAAAGFCAVNAVPALSVAMMISFSMVSVLIISYILILVKDSSDHKSVLTVYMIVTGATVVLRLMPIILIK